MHNPNEHHSKGHGELAPAGGEKCSYCGYSLVGTAMRVCPECGRVTNDEAAYRRMGLRRLKWGLIVLWGFTGVFVAACVVTFLRLRNEDALVGMALLLAGIAAIVAGAVTGGSLFVVGAFARHKPELTRGIATGAVVVAWLTGLVMMAVLVVTRN